ncbi:GcrA family cell cycle regulator [Bradyrhizobium sp. S3.7.6]
MVASNGINTFWTSDRVVILRRLHADGLSASEIGKQLGCTRNAVIGKFNRLKLTGTRPASVRRHNCRKAALRRPFTRQVRKIEEPKREPVAIVAGAGAPVCFDCLGDGDCKAVVSANGEPTMYCGHTRGLNWEGKLSSYCATHHALYLIPPKLPQNTRRAYR